MLKIISFLLLMCFASQHYASKFNDASSINFYLKKQIKLYEKQSYYTQEKINFINRLLRISENDFSIDATDLIALISLESEFNQKATGINKKNKHRKRSVDFGYTQQNSCCIKDRYFRARKVLNKYNINYDIKNKYDVGLNIISATLFLNDIKKDLVKKNQFTRFRMFACYNTGTTHPTGRKLKKAIKYYNALNKIKTKLLES